MFGFNPFLRIGLPDQNTLFRSPNRADSVFHPLPPPLAALHSRVKKAFYPQRILNRNRLFKED